MTDRPNLPGSFKLPGRSLKPGWQVWRFDQIAINVAERVEPDEVDTEYYVGLEHLDSDSLKIRRWGQPSEVEATKLRFCQGDIIFGRRRAYQRKLGVAEFDGICSAHAMVLRPRTEVVLPEFLPFFMQSDLFMNRALDISVGSLSPTINWRTLAEQEFALPPLVEQRRMAEVLWAIETLLENFQTLSEKTNILINSLIEQIISPFMSNTQMDLGNLSDVRYGLTVNSTRRTASNRIPYLRVANVMRGYLDLSEVKDIGQVNGDDEYELQHGDILVVEGHADSMEIGRSAIWRGEIEKCYHQNHLIRIRCGDKLNPEFLVLYLNSTFGRRHFIKHAKSTSGLNTINSSVVRTIPIPLVELDKQQKLVTLVTTIHSQKFTTDSRFETFKSLKQFLLMRLDQ